MSEVHVPPNVEEADKVVRASGAAAVMLENNRVKPDRPDCRFWVQFSVADAAGNRHVEVWVQLTDINYAFGRPAMPGASFSAGQPLDEAVLNDFRRLAEECEEALAALAAA